MNLNLNKMLVPSTYPIAPHRVAMHGLPCKDCIAEIILHVSYCMGIAWFTKMFTNFMNLNILICLKYFLFNSAVINF